MNRDSGEAEIPIESVHLGDAVIETVFERDHAWPVARKVCEGDSQFGSVYALYKHADDPTAAVRKVEGSLIRVIRRPI